MKKEAENGGLDNSTEHLDNVLKQVDRRGIGNYLSQNADVMLDGEKPFTVFMRQTLRKNKIAQRDMFSFAGISEGYGYKLIAMEKLTKDRDLIIRLCLAAHMTLEEVNRALKLYGMSPLYSKIARDAVLIIAFNTNIYDIGEVDSLLEKYHLEVLYNYEDND